MNFNSALQATIGTVAGITAGTATGEVLPPTIDWGIVIQVVVSAIASIAVAWITRQKTPKE